MACDVGGLWHVAYPWNYKFVITPVENYVEMGITLVCAGLEPGSYPQSDCG